MADIQQMVSQLDFLIKASQVYSENTSWAAGTQGPSDPVVLCNRLESAVERSVLPGSSYLKQLEHARGLPQPYKFNAVRSVAMGLRDDLIAGWYSSVVELVHAETYGDYLEMAEGLLDQGYKDPAAVITGTSLEVHVRSLCVKYGVDITTPNGAPKKADTMNADLKKAGVYDGFYQKQITTWMDLRNNAAHGKYSAYDDAQVRLFIEGVRAFMMKYPA